MDPRLAILRVRTTTKLKVGFGSINYVHIYSSYSSIDRFEFKMQFIMRYCNEILAFLCIQNSLRSVSYSRPVITSLGTTILRYSAVDFIACNHRYSHRCKACIPEH